MSALLSDWEKVVPALMMAVGLVLVLIGFVARSRHKLSEEATEEEHQVAPRPQMAPLPRLLSTERSDRRNPADAS
ncbi:hypothetical protein [Bradyrhizobium sp. JR3.5]